MRTLNRLKDENIDKQSSIIRKMHSMNYSAMLLQVWMKIISGSCRGFLWFAFSSEVDVETLDLEYPGLEELFDLKIADIPEPVFLIDGLRGSALTKKVRGQNVKTTIRNNFQKNSYRRRGSSGKRGFRDIQENEVHWE